MGIREDNAAYAKRNIMEGGYSNGHDVGQNAEQPAIDVPDAEGDRLMVSAYHDGILNLAVSFVDENNIDSTLTWNQPGNRVPWTAYVIDGDAMRWLEREGLALEVPGHETNAVDAEGAGMPLRLMAFDRDALAKLDPRGTGRYEGALAKVMSPGACMLLEPMFMETHAGHVRDFIAAEGVDTFEGVERKSDEYDAEVRQYEDYTDEIGF